MIPSSDKFLQVHVKVSSLCTVARTTGVIDRHLFSLQQPTHPVYNIGPDKVIQATMHFLQKPVPGFEEHDDEAPAETATD